MFMTKKATERGFLRRQAASFAAAGRGLWRIIREESHLRFHLVAAAYVLYFSRWFDFSRGEYAAVFALFGLVIGLECVNTALERLSDRVCPTFDPAIGRVKDMAAGAVLAASLCAVGAGVCLFWQPDAWLAVWRDHVGQPVRLALFLLFAGVAAWFVCTWPRRKI